MKTISAFKYQPFSLDLEDHPCSLFIDPASGNVFIDEGPGAERVNGVVLFPEKSPSIVVEQSGTLDEAAVRLHYRDIKLDLGITKQLAEASKWARDANLFLRSWNTTLCGGESSPSFAQRVLNKICDFGRDTRGMKLRLMDAFAAVTESRWMVLGAFVIGILFSAIPLNFAHDQIAFTTAIGDISWFLIAATLLVAIVLGFVPLVQIYVLQQNRRRMNERRSFANASDSWRNLWKTMHVTSNEVDASIGQVLSCAAASAETVFKSPRRLSCVYYSRPADFDLKFALLAITSEGRSALVERQRAELIGRVATSGRILFITDAATQLPSESDCTSFRTKTMLLIPILESTKAAFTCTGVLSVEISQRERVSRQLCDELTAALVPYLTMLQIHAGRGIKRWPLRGLMEIDGFYQTGVGKTGWLSRTHFELPSQVSARRTIKFGTDTNEDAGDS